MQVLSEGSFISVIRGLTRVIIKEWVRGLCIPFGVIWIVNPAKEWNLYTQGLSGLLGLLGLIRLSNLSSQVDQAIRVIRVTPRVKTSTSSIPNIYMSVWTEKMPPESDSGAMYGIGPNGLPGLLTPFLSPEGKYLRSHGTHITYHISHILCICIQGDLKGY